MLLLRLHPTQSKKLVLTSSRIWAKRGSDASCSYGVNKIAPAPDAKVPPLVRAGARRRGVQGHADAAPDQVRAGGGAPPTFTFPTPKLSTQ